MNTLDVVLDITTKMIGPQLLSYNPDTDMWRLPTVIENEGKYYFLKPIHTKDYKHDDLPKINPPYPNEYYVTKSEYKKLILL